MLKIVSGITLEIEFWNLHHIHYFLIIIHLTKQMKPIFHVIYWFLLMLTFEF